MEGFIHPGHVYLRRIKSNGLGCKFFEDVSPLVQEASSVPADRSLLMHPGPVVLDLTLLRHTNALYIMFA